MPGAKNAQIKAVRRLMTVPPQQVNALTIREARLCRPLPSVGMVSALRDGMRKTMEQLLVLQSFQFDLPSRTDERRAAMEKIRDRIPSPVLAHYGRLALRGKKGVAIVRNGGCSECHLRIPSGTLAALAYDNDVHLCDNCGRYLYLPEDEPLGLDESKSPTGLSPSKGQQTARPSHHHAL
jgi:hypothetical protein